MSELYWHCETCGNHERAQPEYVSGDFEPCCLCSNGQARVMSLAEAAALEQRRALSQREPPSGYVVHQCPHSLLWHAVSELHSTNNHPERAAAIAAAWANVDRKVWS